jgi:hypothetical protein
MSNCAYLCSGDQEITYPRFLEAGYDESEQVIASDVSCVPLLWVALFRADDIRRAVIRVEGQAVPVEAPLAATPKALEQFDEARPFFNSLFEREGGLDAYFALFREEIASTRGAFLTIDMWEIACLYPEGMFYQEVRRALESIGQPPASGTKERFARIANLRLEAGFPSAAYLDGEVDGSADDEWNHCRLLGVGPWL